MRSIESRHDEHTSPHSEEDESTREGVHEEEADEQVPQQPIWRPSTQSNTMFEVSPFFLFRYMAMQARTIPQHRSRRANGEKEGQYDARSRNMILKKKKKRDSQKGEAG